MGLRYTFKVERYWADKFLCIYNSRFGKRYVITKHNDQESPDVECEDIVTGEKIGPEIKRFASIKNDIAVDSQLMQGKTVEFGDSFGRRGEVNQIVKELKELISKMKDTSYDEMDVALLLPSVFSIWNCDEFVQIAGSRLNGIADSLKINFVKGVWYFCNDKEGNQNMINLFDY